MAKDAIAKVRYKNIKNIVCIHFCNHGVWGKCLG